MKQIQEPARTVPVLAETDVLVVGSGPGGLAAALAAAREGVDTIGIFPEFLDAYGIVIMPTTGRYFRAPFGIILPQKVETLLVAGRCVASLH